MQRRRLGRLARALDQYLVFAVLGVVAYIIAVNLIAESFAVGIRDRARLTVSEAVAQKAAGTAAAEALWPHRWPAAAVAEVSLLKEAMGYVVASLTAAAPFTAQLPEAQLAACDVALLANAGADATTTAAQLRAAAEAVLRTTAPDVPLTETHAAVREALESAAVVLELKGNVAAAEQVRAVSADVAVTAAPPPTTLPVSSWSAFSREAWRRATAARPVHTVGGVAAVVESLLKVSEQHWKPSASGVAGAVPGVHDSRLLPLSAGTFDAVVPLTRLVLHLWLLAGQRPEDAPLVRTYDAAVESILRHLLHTRTIATGAHAMNFTFVGSRAEAVVPVATPRTCALAGVLAQGIRHGAHRYAGRPTTSLYGESEVLQAAEALATSCFHMYADPAGPKLRSAIYVTSTGNVAGYTRADAVAAPLRSTYCDVPAMLLESFYELYLTTHDAMYGLWATLVMRHDTSDHCGLRNTDVASAAPWRRHLRELRSLWLLLHRMDCLVYRRSRGSRGVCELAANTLVSPITGHLVRLPRASAES
ncbi:Glycosyl hydrolase family 47 [Novymonas esmeraldas]|uniref:Glycosyl hydrolase family 47 n=1 Tax=Novymonas esmeraldas TaxID=1808958 RepID=A0AAW0EUI3_9TRYP